MLDGLGAGQGLACWKVLRLDAAVMRQLRLVQGQVAFEFGHQIDFTQHRIGANGCAAFDVNAACSGFIFALSTADKFVWGRRYLNEAFFADDAALADDDAALCRKLAHQVVAEECALKGLGAAPASLQFSEVYSALQTGLIDGAENNWLSFHSSRQFEVARYWSETLHSMVPDLLLLSARTDALLAADDRELLRDLARRSVPVMREHWDQRINAARSAALAGGVQVNAADREAFRAATRPMVAAHLAAPEIRRLHDQIRALAAGA